MRFCFYHLFILVKGDIRVTKSILSEKCPVVYTFVGQVVSGYLKRHEEAAQWTEGPISMKQTESGQWTITKFFVGGDGRQNEKELMRSRNPESCPPRVTGAWGCGLNPNCSLEDIRKHTKIYAKKSNVETQIEVESFPFECAQVDI